MITHRADKSFLRCKGSGYYLDAVSTGFVNVIRCAVEQGRRQGWFFWVGWPPLARQFSYLDHTNDQKFGLWHPLEIQKLPLWPPLENILATPMLWRGHTCILKVLSIHQLICIQMIGNQMICHKMICNQMICNQMICNQMICNRMIYNQMICNKMVCNQMICNKMICNQMIGNKMIISQIWNQII